MSRRRPPRWCWAVLIGSLIATGCDGAYDSSPTEGPRSWSWTGTAIDDAGTPHACIGLIAASFPPQCNGWSLSGFDWSDVESPQTHGNTTWAEVELVGHPDDGGFVLDQPAKSQARFPATSPACEMVLGHGNGTMAPAEAATVAMSDEARAAGVITTEGLVTLPGNRDTDGDVRIGLLFPTDQARTWLQDHLPGLRINIRPQMQPA